jgi:hypothetical protein
MTVVEIIDMILMPNGDMAAARTVHMRLIGGGHGFSFRVWVSPLQSMIGSVSDEIKGPIEYVVVAFRRARDLGSSGTKLLDRSCDGN